MSTNFQRNRIDANKVVVKALPAAAANHDTSAIDLEQEHGGLIEAIAFEIDVPALPDLADTKKLTITVKDSADGSSFAVVDPAITTVLTGAGGAGAAAKKVRFRLPPHARRYVALNLAVESAGGNNTAKSVTFRALF